MALNKALKTVSNGDGWIDDLGEVGEALPTWKAALVNDLGRSEVSAMPRAVIELATKTHLMLESVDRFIGTAQPCEQVQAATICRGDATPSPGRQPEPVHGPGQLGIGKERKQPVSLPIT